MAVIMYLRIMARMWVVVRPVVSVVCVIVYMVILAVFVLMHMLVKMVVGMDMRVFMGVCHIPVGVLMGVLVSVLVSMNMFVFMCSFHDLCPPFVGWLRHSLSCYYGTPPEAHMSIKRCCLTKIWHFFSRITFLACEEKSAMFLPLNCHIRFNYCGFQSLIYAVRSTGEYPSTILASL